MQLQDMRENLKDVPGFEGLTIEYEPTGHQTLRIDGKVLAVGPAASNEEIRLALKNTLVRTENTRIVSVASPLQGFGQKLSKLKHDAEFDAGKLGSRVDALASRKDAAVAKSTQYLDGHERDIEDIENFVTEIERATNGT